MEALEDCGDIHVHLTLCCSNAVLNSMNPPIAGGVSIAMADNVLHTEKVDWMQVGKE